MPVGTSARSPGPSSTSCALYRSTPASPSWARLGIGRSRSSRTTARGVDTTPKTTLGRVSGRPATSQSVRYRERLTVPWWWWPPAFGVAALVALEVNRAARDLPGLDVVCGVVRDRRRRVDLVRPRRGSVAAGEDGVPVLWAGPAHLPADVITRSAEIPAVGEVRRSGTPARSGRLRPAPALGRPDGAGGARRSRRSDAVLAGEQPPP